MVGRQSVLRVEGVIRWWDITRVGERDLIFGYKMLFIFLIVSSCPLSPRVPPF